MHGLDVVGEGGAVGGAVVAVRARLVLVALLLVLPVDALHVRPQVTAARAPACAIH